jgi:hypothetical protein
VSHKEPGSPDQGQPASRRLRILGILLGFCLLLWLPAEDTSDRWVLIFAAAICSLTGAYTWLWLEIRKGKRAYYLPLAGFVGGALVTPAAFLLMAIKTGLHDHLTPDFTGDQIRAIVLRTPVWIISGLLVGLGAELLRRTDSQYEMDD